MKYLILECHTSYAVALDEQGRYIKVANLNYELGQLVDEVVPMREPAGKVQLLARRLATVAVAAACMLILFFGLIQPNYIVSGSIRLTINPEVLLSVSSSGRVLDIEPLNDDGATLIEGYSYRGKHSTLVTDELILRAMDMNFLIDGGAIKLTISDGTDFQALVEQLDELLLNNNITLIIIPEGAADPGQSPSSTPQGTPAPQATPGVGVSPTPQEGRTLISAQEAGAIALAATHADDVRLVSCELDGDEYIVVIYANGNEYEYEIDAYTGAILDCD
ncbi:MAG: PepSY domain-containing protein, partial [Clostridia bacterium]|nr:PepSY domain-containing protein [Clostridia bacterium]